jgi:hypothetical protein
LLAGLDDIENPIAEATTQRYLEAYRLLTGQDLPDKL